MELSPRCQDNALRDKITHLKFRKTGIDGSNKIRFPTSKTGEIVGTDINILFQCLHVCVCGWVGRALDMKSRNLGLESQFSQEIYSLLESVRF